MGIELRWLDVLQVTREHDHSWLLGVDAVDGFLQHPVVMFHIAADMGIGKQDDTIAVKRFGQVFGRIVDMVYLQFVETDKCPPEEDEPHERDTQKSQEPAVIPH